MIADILKNKKETAALVATTTLDPLRYVLSMYPWGQPGQLEKEEVRQWQADVLNVIGRHLGHYETRHQPLRIAIASGHGIGKSALVSWIIKWGLDTCEDCKVVVTSGTEAQLLSKTWSELAKWNRLSMTASWFKHTATAIYSTAPKTEKTWRGDAMTWSENNTDAFAGLHNKGKRIIVIYDEASAIADKVWEVTEGAMTDEETQILWLAFGNPTRNSGRFRECFRRFQHRWITRQIDSRTVKGVNLTEIQKLVDDNGEDSDVVKVRVRGIFPMTSFKQFINAEDVDKAYGRHLRPEQYNFAPKIIGVDPAWTGEDAIEIVMRQGLYVKLLRTIPKNDNDVEIANIVAMYEDEENADGVIIDAGYGTGIFSAGKTMGRKWHIVWFSAASPDIACLNMRAYMWYKVKHWLKEGAAIPEHPGLRDELIGPEAVPRVDGKIQLESKEDMKRRGLPSPNKADAIGLTFAVAIVKREGKDVRKPKRNSNMSVTKFDPYA